MLRKTGIAAAALGLTAVPLQGCGKSKPKPEPTPTITATTTSSGLRPVGPQPPQDFAQVRGIIYEAKPLLAPAVLTPVPGTDMMQEAFEPQFYTQRDDLGVMRMLGASAVRLLAGIGSETLSDHSKFLDRAEELGLNVIVDLFTPSICPEFDCKPQWQKVTQNALTKQGFAKDGKWHPAVKMVMLMDKPDALPVTDATSIMVVCPAEFPDREPTEHDMAVCRTRLVLSCLDGFLQAEAEAKVDGTDVKIGVGWTFVGGHESLDGVRADELYGFQDMTFGIKNPDMAQYEFKTEVTAVQKAFSSRWVHAINLVASWEYTKEKVLDKYSVFKDYPLLISSWAQTDDAIEDLDAELAAFDKAAKGSKFFAGVVYDGFQTDYSQARPQVKLFSLGKADIGDDMNICNMDPRVQTTTCNKFKLHCLDAANGENSDLVAKAWDGEVIDGVGSCKADEVDVVDVVV